MLKIRQHKHRTVSIKVTATGSGGAAFVLTRTPDADAASELTGGAFTFVEEGTANADNGFVLTTNGTPTLGTTNITFEQFSGAGQISAGAGLTKTGNTIDVVGTADKITVSANALTIASTLCWTVIHYHFRNNHNWCLEW